MADIRTKRVYEEAAPEDGIRILVDRIWPRGLRKEQARVDLWLKEVAPSTALRRWFGHDRSKWEEFKRRYFAELETRTGAVELLLGYVQKGRVTLVFSARDPECNQAVALREYLVQRLGGQEPG